tara:strand:+ start:396 stop:635 length:240 start_codon:yes stop_codon:yes gene_type:complete
MASKQWLWMGIGIMIAVFLNLIVFAGLLPVLDSTPLLLGKDSIIVVGLLIHVILLAFAVWLIYKGMAVREMSPMPAGGA